MNITSFWGLIMVNTYDVLYQLVAILVPITIIILIVYLVRSTKKRNKHLKNIEAKIDELQRKDK